VKVPDDAREGGADESLVRVWVVQPAQLERNQALIAEVDRLHELPLGEVPEVQSAAVPARRDVRGIESSLVGVRLSELG
jgi:hypothetical protein